jgi:hypothetical protein
MNPVHKKARRFLPSAAPTIPTGGKGYSTIEIITRQAVLPPAESFEIRPISAVFSPKLR